MVLTPKKWFTTKEDFFKRKEKAIILIANIEFVSTNKQRWKFTEKQLREEFAFEDCDKKFEKFDNVFFNGDFVIFPEEKTIWV